MNFSCDNCQRRYSIADDRVRGRTVKVRCRNCQALIAIALPSPPAVPRPHHEQKVSPTREPFLALGDVDPSKLPGAGESTAFYIAQAGVNARNPPWKIALFVGGGLAAVVALLAALSSLEVAPLTVTRTDAEGHAVEQPVFSKDSVTGLGSLLLGRSHAQQAPAPSRRRSATTPAAKAAGRGPTSGEDPKGGPTQDELAALYGDARKASVGPRLRHDIEEGVKDTTGGPSEESIAKVVSQSSSAFQLCIEEALRKNPNLEVPKFHVVATVASSGVVTRTSIDRRDIDGSSLGECLKSRAKRMVFASFSGDEVDIEIPLIVGVAM